MAYHTYSTRDQAFDHLSKTGSLTGLSLCTEVVDGAGLGGSRIFTKAGGRERDARGRLVQATDEDRELVREALGDDALLDGARIVPFLLSTGDRVKKDLLRLDPMGWDLDTRFISNPVMLWAHDGGMCAPSRPKIGHWVPKPPDETGLRGLGVFLPRSFGGDVAPSRHAEFAWEIGEMAYRYGFAVSVGFEVALDKPAELSDEEREALGDDADLARDSIRHILYEASPCNIGADPRALAEARMRGMATDMIAEMMSEVLDTAARSPELLEKWRAARGAPVRTVVDMGAREPIVDEEPLTAEVLRAALEARTAS